MVFLLLGPLAFKVKNVLCVRLIRTVCLTIDISSYRIAQQYIQFMVDGKFYDLQMVHCAIFLNYGCFFLYNVKQFVSSLMPLPLEGSVLESSLKTFLQPFHNA